MRPYILFLALAAVTFSSCSTAYRTGQTPDDVYYSPVRPQDEYMVMEQRDDRYYNTDEDYYTDRYLRMRLNNRYQWSALDDYYFNNPYVYNYYGVYNNWYSPWNGYWAWNSYCNPYYISPIIIKNPVRFQQVPSRAVVFNPKSYLNTTPQTSTVNLKTRGGGGSYYNPSYNNGGGSSRYNNSNARSYNYSNSNSNSSSNSRSYTPSTTTPTRSYTPSSSSSSSSRSSSSSSSSSTAPKRPPK